MWIPPPTRSIRMHTPERRLPLEDLMDVFDAGPPTTLAGARRSRTVVFKDSRVASRRFSAHDIRGIGEVDNRAPPSEGESSRAADCPLLGASATLQSQSPPLQLTGDEAGADHMPGCC